MRRATEAIIAARPYAKKMRELLQHLSTQVDVAKYPQFEQREVKGVVIVVVTSDRGLCGAFNSNAIKAATHHIAQRYAELQAAGKVELVCIGKKGFDFFSKRGYKIRSKYTGIFNSLNFAVAKAVSADLVNGFINGEFDKVEIIFNEFKNAAQQRLVTEQFLPVLPEENEQKEALTDYIYEPGKDEIISALVPKHLNFSLWRILLDSHAASQSAQMVAMENASTNAKELLRIYQLNYNKARQAAITKELLEIVGGAEALRNAG